MNEFIDRADLKIKIANHHYTDINDWEAVNEIIDRAKGYSKNGWWSDFNCSVCGARVENLTPYCPQCGARMINI